MVYQHVPVERAAELIGDVTGARPSTGWISSVIAATSQQLTETDALIRTLLILSMVRHVDETTVNVNGRKWWLHVAATSTLTSYFLHTCRGRVAVDQFGILSAFTGVCVHDALSVYDGPDLRQGQPRVLRGAHRKGTGRAGFHCAGGGMARRGGRGVEARCASRAPRVTWGEVQQQLSAVPRQRRGGDRVQRLPELFRFPIGARRDRAWAGICSQAVSSQVRAMMVCQIRFWSDTNRGRLRRPVSFAARIRRSSARARHRIPP